MHAAGHEKFTRALRRALEKNRRLDFKEALLVEKHARSGGDLAADAKIARHLGPTQIEVSIFEPMLFIDLAGGFRIVDLEGKRLGDVEDFEAGDHQFNFARWNLRIVRALG